MSSTAINPRGNNAHPLVIVAAVAVTLFSAAGIAAIMGWIPTSRSDDAQRALKGDAATVAQVAAPATANPAPATTPVAPVPAPVAVREAPPAPAPKAVARPEAPAPKPVVVARNESPAASTPPAATPPATRPEPVAQPQPAPRPVCVDCGTVTAVRAVTQQGDGSGVGAVAGGVVGGVLGHQVGNGRGRDVATVLGAIGGAVAGHQVEKHVRKSTHWVVDVRLDDGSTRSFTHEAQPAWRNGDRVHTEGGVLRSAG